MLKSPFFWSDYRSGQSPAKKRRRRKPSFGLAWKTIACLILVTVLIPLLLRWTPVPISSYIFQAHTSQPSVRYHWVSYQRISHYLPIAVVAAEDQKFPHHWGFDFRAIGSAIEENKRRKTPRGASTITQQVVKNLFLWPGRSYFRKAIEAYFTIMIELLWPKQRILEVYLNIAEFGPGVFGVEAASQTYFNKPASRIRKTEAALFAAVLPNPRKLKVSRPSDYVLRRVGHIERQMAQLGGITYLEGVWPAK
jgi:monofunctional biosynthetic peptidoglycan transglycosylase